MAFGRGGAGNIQAAEQQKTQVLEDVEANLQTAGPVTDRMAPSNQEYAYKGRGGAGNYYSPADLHQSGTFSNAEKSHIVGDGTPAPAGDSANTATQDTTKRYGRGGAGNFFFGQSEAEEKAAQKQAEDERRKEQLSGDIEKGVEQVLAPPPKAKVASHVNDEITNEKLV